MSDQGEGVASRLKRKRVSGMDETNIARVEPKAKKDMAEPKDAAPVKEEEATCVSTSDRFWERVEAVGSQYEDYKGNMCIRGVQEMGVEDDGLEGMSSVRMIIITGRRYHFLVLSSPVT